MADAADIAQEWEQRHLTEALRAHGQRESAAAVLANERGRICLDCGDIIDSERLQVVPNAACCCECQTIREYERG